MNYIKLTESNNFAEVYKVVVDNKSLKSLSLILKEIGINIKDGKISDQNSKYQTLMNLTYRLIGGEYSVINVIRGQYEAMISSKLDNASLSDFDQELLNYYDRILECVTTKKVAKLPVASIKLRKKGITEPTNVSKETRKVETSSKQQLNETKTLQHIRKI